MLNIYRMIKQLHNKNYFINKAEAINTLPLTDGKYFDRKYISYYYFTIYFSRTFYFLIIFFFFTTLANAQTTDNSNSSKQENVIPVKQKIKTEETTVKGDGFKRPVKNNTIRKKNNTTSSGESTKEKTVATNTSTQPPVNFSQLPPDVQTQISKNKLSGKKLLDGVAKTFTVKISECTNVIETNKILSFLKTEKGVFGVKFISSGLVKIEVDPEFDSVTLKDLMKGKGVNFVFLDKYYCLQTSNKE